MTLLGLCAIVFYGAMAATGYLSIELFPQFMVSAVVFIAAGPLLRKLSRSLEQEEEDEGQSPPVVLTERDWSYFTVLLNWMMALMIISCLAVWIMKPMGMPLQDFVFAVVDHDHVFSQIVAP
jgi:hypothetical protein